MNLILRFYYYFVKTQYSIILIQRRFWNKNIFIIFNETVLVLKRKMSFIYIFNQCVMCILIDSRDSNNLSSFQFPVIYLVENSV